MEEGADPETPITMSHEGSCILSLRSTIGQAARLTVEESERSGPRFVPYRPFRAAGLGVDLHDYLAPARERVVVHLFRWLVPPIAERNRIRSLSA
jgi:hypothetical protein